MARTGHPSDHDDVRKGQPSRQIDKATFAARLRQHFADPAFDVAETERARLIDIAWDGDDHARRAPRTRKAGAGHADPDYDLSVDWLAAREPPSRTPPRAGATPRDRRASLPSADRRAATRPARASPPLHTFVLAHGLGRARRGITPGGKGQE